MTTYAATDFTELNLQVSRTWGRLQMARELAHAIPHDTVEAVHGLFDLKIEEAFQAFNAAVLAAAVALGQEQSKRTGCAYQDEGERAGRRIAEAN